MNRDYRTPIYFIRDDEYGLTSKIYANGEAGGYNVQLIYDLNGDALSPAFPFSTKTEALSKATELLGISWGKL